MRYYLAAFALIFITYYWMHNKQDQVDGNSQPQQLSAKDPVPPEDKPSSRDQVQKMTELDRPASSGSSYRREAPKTKTETVEEEVSDFSALDLNKLVEERRCQGCNLQGADLSGLDLQGVDLQGANLKGAIIIGTNLKDADLSGAIASDADFSDSKLYQTNLRGTQLNGAKLLNVDITYGDATSANFANAKLSGSKLLDLHLDNANFANTDLRSVDATGIMAKGAFWDGALMQNTVLVGAELEWHKLSPKQRCQIQVDDERKAKICP